jgi:glycine cleavage system aminomethyltransferase T
MQAGEAFGITPYGLEALSIMRIEKGHVAGGELNGTTTAADFGLGKMMSTKKDYIGRMMATREGLVDPQRQCLVGIRPIDKAAQLRSGSHLVGRNDVPSVETDQGYVSSVAWSPMLNMWVGLALLANGRARLGEIMKVYDGLRGIHLWGEICEPMHYDRENKKLHA